MRDWLWSCRSSATSSPTIQPHSSSRLPVSRPAAGAAPPRDYCPTNVQERILRPRSNFTAAGAPILRRCGKTGWRCGPPVEMLTSSRNWTNRRCAQIRPHHTSQRRHRTHRVVRPHAEDTPRLYARRLRRRVSKRSPVLFVVTRSQQKLSALRGIVRRWLSGFGFAQQPVPLRTLSTQLWVFGLLSACPLARRSHTWWLRRTQVSWRSHSTPQHALHSTLVHHGVLRFAGG